MSETNLAVGCTVLLGHHQGVGEDLVKEGERVRGGLVELSGCSVEGAGTAGTAARRRGEGREGEGTAGTGSRSREENLGWSAC